MLLAWRWDKEGMPWMDFRLGAQCAFARTPLLGSGILKEGVETGRATPSASRRAFSGVCPHGCWGLSRS